MYFTLLYPNIITVKFFNIMAKQKEPKCLCCCRCGKMLSARTECHHHDGQVPPHIAAIQQSQGHHTQPIEKLDHLSSSMDEGSDRAPSLTPNNIDCDTIAFPNIEANPRPKFKSMSLPYFLQLAMPVILLSMQGQLFGQCGERIEGQIQMNPIPNLKRKNMIIVLTWKAWRMNSLDLKMMRITHSLLMIGLKLSGKRNGLRWVRCFTFIPSNVF